MRERVWLEDKDCERLKRSEMTAVRIMMACLSSARYAVEDLKDRLEILPSGAERMEKAVSDLSGVIEDLIGTITVGQAKQLRNTLHDFELRLVPKLTPGTTNLLLTKDQAKDLMDCAREKCRGCVEDGVSCRACELYRLMEALVPLDEYGDLICPYSLAEWED